MFYPILRGVFNMKKIQKGFTLIELMIVVAIIGILAAVAIPAYQDYVVKAKLAKVTSTLDPIKTALSLYFQEYGQFPVVGTATNPITTALSGTALGTVVGTDVWSSVGLTNYPVLPNELSSVSYIPGGVASGVGFSTAALAITLQNVKAATINGLTMALSPTAGVTAAGVIPGAGTVAGATAITWRYACPAAMDVIALKFFNNTGAMCATTTP